VARSPKVVAESSNRTARGLSRPWAATNMPYLQRHSDGRRAVRSCNQEQNTKACNCTYSPCIRKGICCECVTYHRRMGQLPACFFPDDVERTFDRSYERFATTLKSRPRWW